MNTGSRRQDKLIIGTRGSRLALWQAEHVAARLEGDTELRIIRTSGDRFLDQALQGRADKGFFTKEIEDELISGGVDLAVHSLKDLPTELPEGLALGAVGPRASVCDLLLVRPEALDHSRDFPLRPTSGVGATSLRRRALLSRFAPGLKALMLRGNVSTRLDKLGRGDYDAIIIARAGVERLGLDLGDFVVYELNPDIWLPAPGQAALGVEIRDGDERVSRAVRKFHDHDTWRAVRVERGLLSRFEGGCHTAFGAWAKPGEKGMQVLAGHEDASGRWLAARVEAKDDEAALAKAYEKLARVLETGRETERWDKELCREIPSSLHE